MNLLGKRKMRNQSRNNSRVTETANQRTDHVVECAEQTEKVAVWRISKRFSSHRHPPLLHQLHRRPLSLSSSSSQPLCHNIHRPQTSVTCSLSLRTCTLRMLPSYLLSCYSPFLRSSRLALPYLVLSRKVTVHCLCIALADSITLYKCFVFNVNN